MKTRREFIRSAGALALFTGASRIYGSDRLLQTGGAGCANDDPWCQLPAILSRIKAPQFPDKAFDITKYGARGDNKTDSSEAVRKAIAACNAAGGGRVVIPAGEFLSGAIHLKSNVNLHLLEGATLRFVRDTSKYPLVYTRWEGMEL